MAHERASATTAGIKAHDVARDLLAVLGFSVALVIARHVIHTPIGVPGHSAVFWIPVLLLAGRYRMPGCAVACATCGSLFGMGMGDLDAMKIAGVLAASATVDAFGLGQRKRVNALLLLAAGALAHVAKLMTKILATVVAGAPLNAVGVPLLPSLGLYVSFGLIGGVIALAVLYAWTRLSRARGSGDAA